MRQYYNEDDKLWEIMKKCSRGAYEDYSVHDGFLFKGAKLCIPKSSFRELLIRETHGGGLAGHFGINKTLDMLKEHDIEVDVKKEFEKMQFFDINRHLDILVKNKR